MKIGFRMVGNMTGIHTINYGIRFLTKTGVLLGGNELHAPSQTSRQQKNFDKSFP